MQCNGRCLVPGNHASGLMKHCRINSSLGLISLHTLSTSLLIVADVSLSIAMTVRLSFDDSMADGLCKNLPFGVCVKFWSWLSGVASDIDTKVRS